MYSYLIVAVIDYTIAILLLRQGKNRSTYPAMAACFCLGTWSLELFALSVISSKDLLFHVFHITRWGLFFIPFTFALCAHQILSRPSKLYFNVILLPGLISTIALCISDYFLFPSELTLTPDGYLPEPDIHYYWLIFNFLVFSGSAIIYTVFLYRPLNSREKLKIKSVAFIVSIWATIGLIASVFFFRYSELTKYIGALANLSLSLMLYFTSSDERLKSIKNSIIEGLSKLASISFFVIAYLYADEYLSPIQSETDQLLLVFVFVLLVAQVYPYFSGKLAFSFKRIFLKKDIDPGRLIGSVKFNLYKCNSIEAAVNELKLLFVNVLGVSHLIIIPNTKTDLGVNIESSIKNIQPPVLSYGDHLFESNLNGETCFTLQDDGPQEIKRFLEGGIVDVIIPVFNQGDVIAFVGIGDAQNPGEYRFEDFIVFDWVSMDLGEILVDLIEYKHISEELNEARKTLSLLEVMNQYNHDIKTPLAIIDGVVSTDVYDFDKQRSIVIEQVSRGTKLIATMASILRGKRNRTFKFVSIGEILQKSILLFEKKFDAVEVDIEPNVQIYGDEIDLKILFINIIKNASEASDPRRENNLFIRGWMEKGKVIISMRDTGTGMTEGQLGRIWDNEYSAKEFGSAIGMQAIKRISDEHQAKILLTSQLNQGTEVRIEFPIPSPDNMSAY